MPTVKVIGRHRFYFFSKENNEPAHIHVESAENAAKFWLSPIELDWAVGYSSKELRQVRGRGATRPPRVGAASLEGN